MIVELKFNGCAEGVIAQVRERNYPQLVQEFTDRLLLVGINYDKRTKKHECRIEKITRYNKGNSGNEVTADLTLYI